MGSGSPVQITEGGLPSPAQRTRRRSPHPAPTSARTPRVQATLCGAGAAPPQPLPNAPQLLGPPARVLQRTWPAGRACVGGVEGGASALRGQRSLPPKSRWTQAQGQAHAALPAGGDGCSWREPAAPFSTLGQTEDLGPRSGAHRSQASWAWTHPTVTPLCPPGGPLGGCPSVAGPSWLSVAGRDQVKRRLDSVSLRADLDHLTGEQGQLPSAARCPNPKREERRPPRQCNLQKGKFIVDSNHGSCRIQHSGAGSESPEPQPLYKFVG